MDPNPTTFKNSGYFKNYVSCAAGWCERHLLLYVTYLIEAAILRNSIDVIINDSQG